MSYADSRRIPYIILAGDEEIKGSMVTLKTMSTGEQKLMSVDEVVDLLLKV